MAVVHFIQHFAGETGTGWYYTNYDPETKEGYGWFGTANKSQYYFEDCVIDGELKSRTCDIQPGSFWTNWH